MDRTEDPTIEEAAPVDVATTDIAVDHAVEIVEELVEEISIDGMCGVY